MDTRRVGRSLYVIRRARGLRQTDVADLAGVAQSTVSSIERGRLSALSLETLRRVFDALEADVEVVVRYRRGEVDRLLDEGHAQIVMTVAASLRAMGWGVLPEVTFNHFGDRGSIDLLAFHSAAGVALVVEAKTRIEAAEETLRRLDVKARLAVPITEERLGVRPAAVMRLLVIRGSTANRSRVARLEALFGPPFPRRGREVSAFLRRPGPAMVERGPAAAGWRPSSGRAVETLPGGLLFVRDIAPADRTRVRTARTASRRAARPAP